MTTTIDRRVFEEFTSILEGNKPFRNPNKIDFDACRGFKKETTIRCGNRPRRAEEQEEFDNLLSELSARTKHIDATSLYAKMKRFIALTHCTGRHLEDALKAFNKWKAHRKAVVSNPLPMTPSRSATPQADLLELLSDSSDEVSPLLVDDDSGDYDSEDDEPGDDDSREDDSREEDSEEDDSEEDDSEEDDSEEDDSGDDGPVFDSYVTEKMKNMKLDTPGQTIQAETDDSCSDEAKARSEKLKMLGVAHYPVKGMGYDEKKIHNTIRKPLHPNSMPGGIVYILEHTEISGLFKIGYTKRSAYQRLKQPGNCYHVKTRPIHETEGGKFIGAHQAERIAHAILDHKRIKIYECTHCAGYHKEWFLVSRKEACSAVKLAEQWLKMPAYALHQQEGEYELTPNGDTVFQLMFPFSIPKMRALIDKTGKSDNDSDASPNATSAATARKKGANVSSAVKKNNPRIFIDGSEAIMPSVEHNLRERSPVRGVGDKRAGIQIEIEEVSERRESRSRTRTPEGDYIIVTEYTTIRRRRVSVSDHKHDGAFDLKDERPRGTAAAKV
ncbi:hypothetical protein THAR02_04618 [Trichoderma harzianum]|uniref:Bacteriophage T5 Orf172 DNA-binding domain-containing protein n=1 Tax=Trichoderma harzianum TaxID=5544 RepID=A0A0F9XFI4_TRIHA|nr:hypothetical protein THAR02_04618 [Trichoderma harzianum]